MNETSDTSLVIDTIIKSSFVPTVEMRPTFAAMMVDPISYSEVEMAIHVLTKNTQINLLLAGTTQ